MRSTLDTTLWIAVGLAFAVAIGVFAWAAWSPVPPEWTWTVPALQPAPQTAADPIDGEPVTRQAIGRRPIAIVIDNHPEARPQWGLSGASRVYEALTEGGITRYLAVFGRQDADQVGPVRSVRTQFLGYAAELDAAIAHVGGNADALDLIAMLRITHFDEFRYPVAYRRIQRRGIALEHTVFTSTAAVRALAAQTAGGESQPVEPQRWKDDLPRDHRPQAAHATIDFSTPAYRVSWVYRPDSNDYARMLAHAPDVDAATGTGLTAKVIAIAVIPRTHGRTRIQEDTWTFADLGSGQAWILEDGAVVPGTWRKAVRSSPLRFFDDSGREIAFDRGPEWIEIIPSEIAPSFE